MPQVAVAAAAAATKSLLVKAGLNTTVASLLSATAAAVVSSALSDSERKSIPATSVDNRGLQFNTVSSDTPSNIIYGKQRVGGQLVFRSTTDTVSNSQIVLQGQANNFFHVLVAFSGHESNEIETVYLDDESIVIDSDTGFAVNEKYLKLNQKGGVDNSAYIYKIENTLTGVTIEEGERVDNPSYVAGWTLWGPKSLGSFNKIYLKGLPISRTNLIQKNDIIKLSSGVSFTSAETVSTDINGEAVFVVEETFLSSDAFSYNKSISGSEEFLIFFNGSVVNVENKIVVSHIYIENYLGSDDQHASALMVNDIDIWTSDHRLRGVTYSYLRFQYNTNIFPNFPVITADIKGKKVYDPRTDTTYYSNNTALVLRDYLTNTSYGLGIDSSYIDDTYVIAAANICDESVSLSSGGTQSRYTCNVVLSSGESPLNNIDIILSSMAGTLVQVGDKFRVYAGAFDTPSITIDESWLRGDINMSTSTRRRDIFNSVKGTFFDSENEYREIDFPSLTNPAYVTEDNEIQIYKDFEFTSITDSERAQRIAKISLESIRQGITVSMSCNFKALQLSVWDTVYVDNDKFGWSSKTFRIVDYSLNANNDGVNLVLKEDVSGIYSWDSGEATTYDIAPNTNLPDATIAVPPSNIQVMEEIFVPANAGGAATKCIITWDPSNDIYVNRYQVEFVDATKIESLGDFNGEFYPIDRNFKVLSQVQGNRFEQINLRPGTYVFRVKAINQLNVSSEYVEKRVDLKGLSDPPGDIANFSINVINNNAHLTWDQSTDIDVKAGGKIYIKHTPDTSGASWSSSVEVVPAQQGTATQVIAPLMDGTYLIKAVDSSGNESISAQKITISTPNIINMNQVLSSTESPLFTGTKTNMAVFEDNLILDGTTLFDSLSGNFDDAEGYFDGGGLSGYQNFGSYLFSNYLDIGKVATSRVTANIKSVIQDPNDLFDSRDGLFDSQPGLFDGSEFSNIRSKLYIRTTNDNPSNSPTWSDWKQFFVGDYNARAFEFKLEVESDNASFNIQVSELSVTVDMPDQTDSGTSTGSASADVTVNFLKAFYSAPTVVGSIVSSATGDYISITNITASSFDFSVYNSGGTRTTKQLYWIADGY